MDFCKKTYPDLWQKRFEEDLVEVLTKMGHKPGATVKLKVRPLDAKDAHVLERVPMTKENRTALWKARLEAEQKAGPAKRPERPAGEPRRVQRAHAGKILEEYQFLRNAVAFGTDPGAPVLSRRQAEEDLDELEWHLEHRYSYLKLKNVDYRAALDAVRAGLGEQVSRDAFAVQLMKVLALFGDGHTRVNDRPLPAGYTPFLVGEAEGRLVAFRPDRSGFVDADHPFLKRLDGLDVAKWLQAAARLGPGGSPQALRRQSVENLRYVQYLRHELGLKAGEVLRLELESADAKRARAVEVRITHDQPASGPWPRGGHRRLAGDVGYLRLDRMSDRPAFLKELVEAMAGFRDTKGLILDVRGNGGGSRAALRELFPFFLRPDDPPRVANVAAYRLGEGEKADEPEGFLQNRFLYPAASREWNDEDRAAIARVAAGFRPEWAPPAGQFSAWHYFLLRPRAGGAYYHYGRPVVVLMDAGCFSATDIFLGAFKGWRNVTLLGAASGGGSGRARPLRLHHSGLQLQLSSIASFQPDGKLYDDRGVVPDVEASSIATDLIGSTDSVLEAALKRLR